MQRQKYNIGRPKSYSGSTSKGSGYMNGDRSRQQDFLQGLIMKIRFTKRLRQEELEKIHGSGKDRTPDSNSVINLFDKVQIKLTQLELNSVRVMVNSKCIGKWRAEEECFGEFV